MEKDIQHCHKYGERRDTVLNLAWTAPCDNTPLNEDIPLSKVASMAMDMFCDTSALAPTAAPLTNKGPEEGKPVPNNSALGTARCENTPWRIPAQVEKGFEIPIAITSADVVPELGSFKRLAMDVVVNAVCVALWWAKTEKNKQAEPALESFILEWPLDFVWIKGNTPEEVSETMFIWSVNVGARAERLRSFVGLENTNLMRIVAKATDIAKAKFCVNNLSLIHI